MLPSSAEVMRSLHGSWRLMREGEGALSTFDVTAEGLLRSFGAILLTLPAFVAVLAAERLRLGLSNAAGLFEEPTLAAQLLLLPALSFLVIPAAILALFWSVARTARGTGFVVAWNWTEVMVSLILAAPAAMLAAGLVPGSLAQAVTLAFAVIAARLRYAVVRSALGLAAPMAATVVVTAFAVEVGAAWTLPLGRF